MSASELSPQNEFGRKNCDLPGRESVWVKFKTSGYPRRLRREWDAANADQTLEILLRYIDAWELSDLDGQPIILPDPRGLRPAALLDNVEDALVSWMIRAFVGFWIRELTNPRPNSSAPLPTT